MFWQPQLAIVILVCCYTGFSVSNTLFQVDKDDTPPETKVAIDTDNKSRSGDVDTLNEMDDALEGNDLDTSKEILHTKEDFADSGGMFASHSDSCSKMDCQEAKSGGSAFVSDGTVHITKAKDCASLYKMGIHKSGIYQLHIEDPGNSRPLTPQVYCELSDSDIDGGGWTYIQSRVNDRVDFYRYWDEYKRGFGDPTGNYWAGLNVMHELTKEPTELMVYLETFDGGSGYAHYNHFSVGEASTNYTLSLGDYSGTAGNSLSPSNNNMFSTRGRDNDEHASIFCAEDDMHKGGWWYRMCGRCNLNGVYYSSTYTGSNYGIHWYHYRDNKSIPIFRHVYMKIRVK